MAPTQGELDPASRSRRSVVAAASLMLRAHPIACAAIASCYVLALTTAFAADKGLHGVGYVFVTLLVPLVVHTLTPDIPSPTPQPVVARPRLEAAILLAFAAVRFVAFCFLQGERFGLDRPTGFLRLGLVIGVFALVFPTLTTVVLWRRGARWTEQGLRPRKLWLAPVVVALVAAGAFVCARDRMHQTLAAIGGMASFGMMISLFLQASAEELLRYQHQTRFGAAFGSAPAGWLISGLLWTWLHIPGTFGGDWTFSLVVGAGLVPMGVMWSYISHRTGSIWPAALAHAFNWWGLQAL